MTQPAPLVVFYFAIRPGASKRPFEVPSALGFFP
jgi:hypothetical protein